MSDELMPLKMCAFHLGRIGLNGKSFMELPIEITETKGVCFVCNAINEAEYERYAE
jgi:hypothetical protein